MGDGEVKGRFLLLEVLTAESVDETCSVDRFFVGFWGLDSNLTLPSTESDFEEMDDSLATAGDGPPGKICDCISHCI